MSEKSSILRFYRQPALTPTKTKETLNKLQKTNAAVQQLDTELCFHVEISNKQLTESEKQTLKWILQDPYAPQSLTEKTNLKNAEGTVLIEVGPRFNFSTANSTNAVGICHSLGLKSIARLEVSRRYLLTLKNNYNLSKQDEEALVGVLHDRMTECRYTSDNIPQNSFNEKLVKKEELVDVDVLKDGRNALEKISNELGLAFDEADLDYYTNLFKNVLKRNPTSVECFDLAQSNSEHSRHWFFKGKMVIDGEEFEESLIDMIIKTQEFSNRNNVIKFSDNSRLVDAF